MHYLTNDWDDFDEIANTAWRNTEFRSYMFATTDAADLNLVETPESKTIRRQKFEKEEGHHSKAVSSEVNTVEQEKKKEGVII